MSSLSLVECFGCASFPSSPDHKLTMAGVILYIASFATINGDFSHFDSEFRRLEQLQSLHNTPVHSLYLHNRH